MKIEKIGEFGLIKRLSRFIKNDASVIRGPGDDCAVVAYDKTRYMLLTCDMLVEGVDFTARQNPELIGRKALAVSLSDIAACSGVPRYALVSLGLPAAVSVEKIEKIWRGMNRLARAFGLNIVGGDMSKAAALTIDVSMLGLVEKKRLVTRGRARAGDIIFVSGPLGGSIRGKHLRFIPRLKEARFLTAHFTVHAMIDISDGLAQDLWHILEASKVGAVLYEKMIPQSRQCLCLKDALSGGEDFELLFTVPPKDALKLLSKGQGKYYPIGFITGKDLGFRLAGANGRETDIKPEGYRHF
ncbi:MAG TPA: thiamine-phosphate kinase [Patescibacteria group bacterium]|nr:thiamine-phosphate kinase [Patescibacteria group bacterium]